jgi:hypothetical protein
MIDSVIVPTSTYDNRILAASLPFPNLESNWNTPMYEPQQQVPGHVSSWNLPHWMPSLDYTPQIPVGADEFQYTTQHTSQQVYHQLPTPPQQTIEPVSSADLFILGSMTNCRSHQEQQARTNANVRPHPSSPYPLGPYFRSA